MFVFKEKLKKLKFDLKIWNKEVFGNVNQVGELLQKRIQELDECDDAGGLNKEGREEKKSLLAEQNKNFFKQEAIIHQKAHIKWMKDGDLNSKFFQSAVKWRRMRNGLNGLFINGCWCEDKELVKDKVREFFEARFESGDGPQVRLDNVPFSYVSDADNEMLVKFFSEEEIKLAI